MKKFVAVLGVILLLAAIGCTGNSTVTGSDSNQTIRQNDDSTTPTVQQAPKGDPDDIIDGNKGGG